jgi:hypothetical protein
LSEAAERRNALRLLRPTRCYFFGGLVGSAVLGQVFDRFGWTACTIGVGGSLALAAWFTGRLHAA